MDYKGATDPIVTSLDALAADVPRWMDELAVPGLAVAIIRKGFPTWARGFGVTNVDRPEPIRPNTAFQSASLSKPVAAYGFLHHCLSGGIDLDQPLVDHIAVPDEVPSGLPIDRITPRTALSHTSGLPNGKHLRESMDMPHAPGQRFCYSGIGYNLLQQALETTTGQSFNAYITDNVFRPLGMIRTSYVWMDAFQNHIADGHGTSGQPLPHNPRYEALAAISLYTTASDYARFLGEILKPHDENYRVVALMQEGHTRISTTLGWGLGWSVQDTDWAQSFWHFGENYHCRSIAMGFPDKGAGIVKLSASHNGLAIYRRVIETLTGIEHPALWFIDHFEEYTRF